MVYFWSLILSLKMTDFWPEYPIEVYEDNPWLLLLLLSRVSRVRLCDPIDASPPGSPVPGILQARTLEWAAISFSNAWKWKGKVKSLSRVRLLATPWTIAYQAPPPMLLSRQEYWSGVPLPSLGSLHMYSQIIACSSAPGFLLMSLPENLGSFLRNWLST